MFSGRAIDNSIQNGGNPSKRYIHVRTVMPLRKCATLSYALEGSKDSGAYGFREICRRAHQHHRSSAHFLLARWLYIPSAHSPCSVPCVPWRQTSLCILVSEGERKYIARKHVKIKPVSKCFDRPGPDCDS